MIGLESYSSVLMKSCIDLYVKCMAIKTNYNIKNLYIDLEIFLNPFLGKNLNFNNPKEKKIVKTF